MLEKIKDVFEINAPEGAMIEVREPKEGNETLIPKKNKGYVHRTEVLADILSWVMGACGKAPLYLAGPTGTGKSTAIEQVAACLNVPCFVVSCHEAMEAPELMGRFVVREGNMQWEDGPLLKGLKHPDGAWVLLDEVDTLRPGAAMALNALIEGRTVMVPETGELIDPTKFGARIVCAGNTNGAGDNGTGYSGTNMQNRALMGRFVMLRVNYPDPEVEFKIVSGNAPDLEPEKIKTMIKVANEVRKLAENGETEVVFCTRSLIHWAMIARFNEQKPGVNPVIYALDRAIGFKYDEPSRIGLHELTQRVFGEAAA